MNIAICDDELIFAEKLLHRVQKEFERHEEECSFVTVTSGEKLIKLCKEKKIDVVFLDVVMPELNGFKTADEIRKLRKSIILVFVSGKNDAVFSSYEYNPIWFIPKKQMDLMGRAVDKIIEKKKALDEENRIIQLKLGNRIMDIDQKNVLYMKTDGHYVRIIDKDGGVSESFRCKLKDIEPQLKSTWFFRPHNRYLVNLSLSNEIKNGCIILRNGEQIPISRSKIECTKEKFQDYLRSIR